MKEEIYKEINEIENAMACDDSVSSFSFAYSQAEDRLKFLRKELKKFINLSGDNTKIYGKSN